MIFSFQKRLHLQNYYTCKHNIIKITKQKWFFTQFWQT